MAKNIRFVAFAFTGDDGKFEVKDNGKLVVGVLLTGDLPRGEKFFEFSSVEDVNTAVDMLTEYNSRKWRKCKCGVRNDVNSILIGLCPLDFDDDSYIDFAFTDHEAACVAFDLVNTFAKYQFGIDDTNTEWESSLNTDA